jgi:leucyl aminopeptidase
MGKDTIIRGLEKAKYHFQNLAQGKETPYELLSKVRNRAIEYPLMLGVESQTKRTQNLYNSRQTDELPAILGTPEQMQKLLKKLEDLEKAKLEPLNLPPLEESDVSCLLSDIEKQRKEPAPWYEI